MFATPRYANESRIRGKILPIGFHQIHSSRCALLPELVQAQPKLQRDASPRQQAGSIVTQLSWLPPDPARRDRLRALRATTVPSEFAWDEAVAIANTQLDFTATNALDAAVRALFHNTPPPSLATKPVRLAVLGSSTLTHLLPAIRVAGLRRGIWIDTYENDYGQYRQELANPGSALHAFQPNLVLLATELQLSRRRLEGVIERASSPVHPLLVP